MAFTLDGRAFPGPQADERAMLDGWLEFHRATLELKCKGLDDGQLRIASVEPSPMTLLGLVQHMALVERKWFQLVFDGQDIRMPESGNGFTLSPGAGTDDVLAEWRAAVERGRELTAASSLDECGQLPEHEAAIVGVKELSLRWILTHMIEEYARHNGHADLLRECIDGATGT